MSWLRPGLRAPRRQPWPVWCLTAALAVAVAVTWSRVAAVAPPTHPPGRVPWWLLVLGFAAGQAVALRFELFGETHVTSLSQIPLVIGLVFVGGPHLLLATVLGSAAGTALRRQRLVKSAFNVTIRAVETMVAVWCFHLVLGHHPVLSGFGWLAVFVAVPVADLVSAVCVQAVIALSVGRRYRLALRPLLPVLAGLDVLNVAVAWVTVALIWYTPAAAVASLGIAAVLGAGYQAHSGLRRRHRDLQQIYRFSSEVSRLAESDEVIEAVLVETNNLARSRVAVLALTDGDGTATYTLDCDGRMARRSDPPAHPMLAVTAKAGGGILARRPGNDPVLAEALAASGLHDAVAATVVVGQECLGVLVAGDRLNEHQPFEADDLAIIRALATHTAMALRSSRLLDQLRQEVAAKDHQALHDGLTGLANRSLFNDRVEAMLGERSGESVVAVMVMDLDRFKEVNDTLGHHTGDVVLQQIAAQLAGAVAGRGVVVARLGGDEFAFVCGAATRAAVAAVAGDVLAAGQATMVVEGLRLEVRASLGVALAPDHGGDRSTLLRRADIAMYHAKTVGSGIEVYQPQRDPHTTRRLVLASELRLALETSALELHYQPKAEILTGRVSGVEALLRWTHPVYGPVGPDEFIPLAEQSGLMRPLTMWALEASVSQLAVWRREGLELTLAVNLSARSVFDAQLADDLDRLLARCGVPAGALTLEITESSLFGDRPKGHTALDHLADLGVRLAIDDFGTGYSSLSRLARLPVQEVKIDKSFVTTMLTNDGHDAIVRSTIDLARNLRLRVVAEGVEDEATWRRLGRLGCDAGQGYYLSAPLRAAELAAWLWRYQRRQHGPARTLHVVGRRPR